MSVLREEVLSIAEACKISRVSFETAWRWILRGIKKPNGEKVRLEGVRLGHKWVTSREALERFAAELTPTEEDSEGIIPIGRTLSKRRKASEAAEKELEKVGI